MMQRFCQPQALKCSSSITGLCYCRFVWLICWGSNRLLQTSRRVRTYTSFLVGGYALGLYGLVALRALGARAWWLDFLGNFTPPLLAGMIALLGMAVAVRARRGALLALPLAAVGAAWYVSLWLPKPAPTLDPSLSVITFNIYDAPPESVRARILAVDADVVLLQEAIRPEVEALNLAETYPYRVPSTARGNTILSRFPILEAEAVVLAENERPIQRAVIDVNGQPVVFYNVHFSLPVGEQAHIPLPTQLRLLDWLARYDETMRDVQIEELLAAVERENSPVIIGGDFNMSDQAAAYRALNAALGDTYREVGFGFGGTWFSPRHLGLPLPAPLRIDYLWHSESVVPLHAQVAAYAGSDHLPLTASFALLG